MTLFLSHAGNQPSAVAVAYRTWQTHRGAVDRVILLSTPPTRDLSDRLKRWITDAECAIVDVAPGTDRHATLPTAMNAVRDILQQISAETDVVFLGDPGLKSSIVTVARLLPAGATFLHAEATKLHTCLVKAGVECWESFALADLGTNGLLDLYGPKREKAGQELPETLTRLERQGIAIPDYVIRNLRFAGKPSVPTLHLAYEARGQLFGLVVIEGGKVDPVQAKTLLQETRDVQRMTVELEGLRPRLTVLSNGKRILARAQAAGIQAIDGTTGDGLAKWLSRDAPLPGRAVSRAGRPRGSVVADAMRYGHTRAKVVGLMDSGLPGKGGDGVPLAVCLGTDPSSTLLAICTHRPSVCYLLYDCDTPDVVLLAERLKNVVGDLPLGRLIMVPTDLLGRGVQAKLMARAAGEERLAINITPGTKAQGCALARIQDADLWSLRTDSGHAQCLMCDDTAGIAIAAPPVLVQARVIGGDLVSEGVAETAETANSPFWRLTFQLLAAYARNTQQPFMLDKIHWKKSSLRRQHNRYRVSFNGQQAVGTFRNANGGFWFEEVVAKAFVLAGADEVRAGIRWDWPQGLRVITEDGPAFKDDLDVAVRFGFRYFAVSCKTSGRNQDKDKREIEAVAGACLGRFTIPVLVAPRFPEESITASLRAKHGAILLNMAVLSDPNRLRDSLDLATRSRRTVQDG